MTEEVVFDAWAWMEILGGTHAGARLRRRYLEREDVRILTVDVTLAEVSARMVQDGGAELVDEVLDTMLAASTAVVPIGRDDAALAGPLRGELRKASKRDASLVDAVVLSVARNRGARLVSGDRAYDGQLDVVGAE